MFANKEVMRTRAAEWRRYAITRGEGDSDAIPTVIEYIVNVERGLDVFVCSSTQRVVRAGVSLSVLSSIERLRHSEVRPVL